MPLNPQSPAPTDTPTGEVEAVEALEPAHPLPPPGASLEPLPMHIVKERLGRCLTPEYRRSLYYFVLRRVGNPDEAEDLAQQALVEATQHIHRFRGEAEVSTWVHGIALNLARNHLSRSPQRRMVFESDEILEESESPNSDPCDKAIQRQALVQLSEALRSLPEGSVRALMLVAVDGLSYEDAAAELGVPVGTIRSRVSRARAEVRHRLQSHLR
jgi:RNA polymerase sigma factor (sigma-70 family)